MRRQPLPYSKHSLAELEAARDPHRKQRLRDFHRQRIEQKRTDHYKQTENIKVTISELQELLDILDGDCEEHLKVDLRSLADRLRIAEQELIVAADALADQMGLVGT
jgi:diacylglycerol kinase family enzyme